MADQFSGVNYCYTIDIDTTCILGGYGYDLAQGREMTFPVMTIFPVKTLIDSVVQRKDYLWLFEAVGDDDQLAVTEGTLVRIGQYFLVYNGRQFGCAHFFEKNRGSDLTGLFSETSEPPR